jgi:hypothetical protein
MYCAIIGVTRCASAATVEDLEVSVKEAEAVRMPRDAIKNPPQAARVREAFNN